MYSGFVTRKRSLKSVGVHQRFNRAAYRMIENFLAPEAFPDLREIQHFEGVNGPDGLKVKSPDKKEANHIYDPVAGGGDVPRRITAHYGQLVQALRREDHTRAAFEAGWLAHYLTDGMTPAHHHPIRKLREGQKGTISTHVNFEMGVAVAILLFPLRLSLDTDKLAQARRLGHLEFFRQEAREIHTFKVYEKFCDKGWTAEIARTVKETIAPRASQVIGIIWLLAYLEAGQFAAAEIKPVLATA